MVITAKGRNSQINNWGTLLNGGTMQLRKADETLIATLTFANPAFNTAPATSTGVITANAIGDGTVVSTNLIDHATLIDSASDAIVELTVTVTGGGGELTLSAIDLTIGDVVSITGGTFTQPAS